MPEPPARALKAYGSQGCFRGPSGWGCGSREVLAGPLAGAGTHIGVLLVQVLVSLLQDVVWVPNLLPDVHGLGRTLGPACACLTVGILALSLASLRCG